MNLLTNSNSLTDNSNTLSGPGYNADAPGKDEKDEYYYSPNSFGLSKRELEVLFFVAEGMSNIEIAKILGISRYTVKDHVISIFNKFGVNNRTQASVRAVRYNII